MWLGFWSVEVLAPPEVGSPKFQAQLVGVFDDVSVKMTFSDAGLPVVDVRR